MFKEKMKKISILITSYNLESYIDVAINSVVRQQMPCDWELLIGDDGSTDRTVQLVEVWVSKYPQNIKLFQWAKDEDHAMSGFRSAANRAKLLLQCTGDYIIFLDGDDCWLGTEKLKKQFDILENQENLDCSCCGHNIYKVLNEERNPEMCLSPLVPRRKYSKQQYYHGGIYVHTNTILFRSCCKELMLKMPYKDFLNDIFITFCLLQYGKMFYIPDALAQYNMTGTGLWTGAKIIFSKFRNVHLYDLEVNIDPLFEPVIFDSLCGNMLVILSDYSKEDIPIVTPLIQGLDQEVFKCTLALYKLNNLTTQEKTYKRKLRCRILFSRFRSKIYRMYDKLYNSFLRMSQ